MPFDNTNVLRESAVRDPPVSPDPLERLGIIPVPPEFVEFYKKDYRKRFLASKGPKGPGPFKWLDCIMDYSDVSVRWFLTRHPIYFTSDDASAAPDEVIDLAEKVVRNVSGARLSLSYFYTDPIVSVHYRFDGEQREACLAIWDRGAVIAIANQPVVIPERRGFFATLFGGRRAA